MSLDQMIKNAVRCTVCGAGYGKCDCWSRCECGWSYRKGEACRNPKTDQHHLYSRIIRREVSGARRSRHRGTARGFSCGATLTSASTSRRSARSARGASMA